MAAAHVQSNSNQATTATSVAVTMGSALTVGNIVMVGLSVNSTAMDMNTPTDDKGNQYRAVAAKLAVRVPAIQLFYCLPTISAATVVTGTCGASATIDIVVSEFSGQASNTVSSFAVVNRTTVNLQTSPVAVTIPSATVGNTLIVAVTNGDNRTVSTVTDNKSGGSNTYTKNKELTQASLWSARVAGACTIVTVTVSAGGSTSVHVDIMEVSGCAGTAAAATANHNSTGTATSTAAAVTSFGSNAGNMIIAVVVAGGNRGFTPGTGYTRMTTGANGDQIIGFSQYKLSAGTTETAPATIDSSTLWAEVAVEYLPTVTQFGTGGAGSAASGTALTSNLAGFTPTAGSLIWVFASANAAETYTAGSGYTLSKDGTNAGAEYLLSASGSAETTPFTMDATAAWELEAFEILVAAAAATVTYRKMLLGVGV